MTVFRLINASKTSGGQPTYPGPFGIAFR